MKRADILKDHNCFMTECPPHRKPVNQPAVKIDQNQNNLEFCYFQGCF